MKKFIGIICAAALLTGCTNYDEEHNISVPDPRSSSSSESETETDETETTTTTTITQTTKTTTTVTTTAKAPEKTKEIDWKSEYKNILNQYLSGSVADGTVFQILEMTGDKTPELVVAEDYQKADIYTIVDNNVKKLEIRDATIYYCSDIDRMYVAKTGTPSQTDISKFENGELKTEHTYISDYSSKYNIDGKDVTEQEYTSETALVTNGYMHYLHRGMPLNYNFVDYVFAEGTDWKKVYSNVLADFSKTADSDMQEGFSLFDITGDGTPELFVSEGFYHVAGCEIFTFDGGLKYIGSMGVYGSVTYDADKKQLLVGDGHMGYVYGQYLSLDANYMPHVEYSYSDDEGAYPPEEQSKAVYRINGMVVPADEYKKEMERLSAPTTRYGLGTDNELSAENASRVESGNYKQPQEFNY